MSAGVRPGAHNDLTDVAGIRVGHHHRRGRGWLTGTTVVLPPAGTVGSVDVRGGGPASRETDALAPTALVDVVHGVVLSGGSAYGLAAADGVIGWLAARRTGYPVGPGPDQVVPIVPAACLFDLYEPSRFTRRPDAAWGEAAARAASARPLAQGCVGAGTGARIGRAGGGPALKGGLGSASAVLPDGTTVAALVALNSSGGVADPVTGVLHGAPYGLPGEWRLRRPSRSEVRAAGARSGTAAGPPADVEADRGPLQATALAVVATDAELTKSEAYRMAVAAHDGLARAIRPAHGMTDGDLVFALATGGHVPPPDRAAGGLGGARIVRLSSLMAAAADAVTRAVVHGVLAASGADGLLSYAEAFPSAVGRE